MRGPSAFISYDFGLCWRVVDFLSFRMISKEPKGTVPSVDASVKSGTAA